MTIVTVSEEVVEKYNGVYGIKGFKIIANGILLFFFF